MFRGFTIKGLWMHKWAKNIDLMENLEVRKILLDGMRDGTFETKV